MAVVCLSVCLSRAKTRMKGRNNLKIPRRVTQFRGRKVKGQGNKVTYQNEDNGRVNVIRLTGQQGVSVVLLQNATDARYVLDGELEHYQVHRSFTYLVVLVQISASYGIGA